MQKAELLLPVGSYDMCVAAIHNGADAVYMGMPYFNARGRSQDFDLDELKEMIDLCHLYDVKVNLALNILIFENEISEVVELLEKVLPMGPDALIVQDLGLVKIINTICPEQVIHASTQMTVTSSEAMDLVSDLKIKRFVLGRENTIEDIRKIKNSTDKEIEVFVHGALCVAYSGQCFTSETLGGRSANRGQCAQSCRFEYSLYVDDKLKDLDGKRYLVSPQDLCGIGDIKTLMDIGVDSFKVEGRLKGPSYVASVAREYKLAMTQNLQSFDDARFKMAQVYSRGFYSGWMHGVAHQDLVTGKSSSNLGALVGKITSIDLEKRRIYLKTEHKLENGQGVSFNLNDKIIGSHIYGEGSDRLGTYIILNREFNLKQLQKGDDVYLNQNPKLEDELKKSYTLKENLKRLPLELTIEAQIGYPLVIKAKVLETQVSVTGHESVSSAQKRPATLQDLQKNLEGLSHTAYKLVDVKLENDADFFISNGEVKKIKQDLIEKLNYARVKREIELAIFSTTINLEKKSSEVFPKLNIVVRTLSQLEGLIAYLDKKPENKILIGTIIADYEYGKDYVNSVNMIKCAGIKAGMSTTRIFKPGENHNFRLIERANPDVVLVRNLGALAYFQNSAFELIGDFSLNVANSYTANYLSNKKLKTICASLDLNKWQLTDMLQNVDSSKIEVALHQYMPEFHMEHCVFAAFLSKGQSFRDCGKPCEKHKVYLKDMFGHNHEIKADSECRNTMFKSEAFTALPVFQELKAQGIEYFRFESLHESADILIKKLELYFEYLKSDIMELSTTLDRLQSLDHFGVTHGQFLNQKTYQDRKQKNL